MSVFNKEELKEKFLTIARSKPALQGLLDSQIIGSVNIHQTMAAEYAAYDTERSFQESFLASAINRSSILAAAFDRNYTPRKPTPSNGVARIVNKKDTAFSIPAGQVFLSEDQVPYEIVEPVQVDPATNTLVRINQIKRESIEYTVEESIAFLEYVLEPELSITVSDIKVFVDDEEWKQTKLFHNTNGDSKVYRELYTPSDELGIHFGNGDFGKIPEIGSIVRLELILTDGNITLLQNQPLYAVSENLDLTNVEIVTGNVIEGGTHIESTEETRKNGLYYFMYDEQHVWNDDYEFFIRQNFPNALFVKAWGEEKQEKMDGERKFENVNAIFFSVYDPSSPNVAVDVQARLEEIPEFNRFFKHTAYQDKKFTVSIDGKVKRSLIIETVRDQIIETLTTYYGKNSKDRREKALIRDMYRLMNGLDVFESQDDVFITLNGDSQPDKLYDLVSIDLDNSTIQLGY